MTTTTSTVLAVVLVATAAVVIGGLIVIPVIEAADAANAISDANNKGRRGRLESGRGKPINLDYIVPEIGPLYHIMMKIQNPNDPILANWELPEWAQILSTINGPGDHQSLLGLKV